MEGRASLFHIGGDLLWKSPFSLDSTTLADFPGLVPSELSHDGYFDALNDFLFRLTDPIGQELAGDMHTADVYVGTDEHLADSEEARERAKASGDSSEDDGDDDPESGEE